ncbi:MAG: lipid-A-disaccharide synthase N-terminal domain-containing protein [Planctomycetes bacterium]|nr:lipid-A-disaccharide synthase N-terminal domain-containing protein [Planctomycetota bacterium]
MWIAVGFAGQALFTLRMVLQWYASEKEKRSVVPVAFWWGSLAGGILLLSYFVWRKDVVGVVGQSTGVFVYARNLILIHQNRARPTPIPQSPWPAPSSPPPSPMPTGRSTSAT